MSLSREEFLKRYMGAPEPVSDVVEKKKKKKKIKTKRSQGIIVVDNDLTIDNSFKDEGTVLIYLFLNCEADYCSY